MRSGESRQYNFKNYTQENSIKRSLSFNFNFIINAKKWNAFMKISLTVKSSSLITNVRFFLPNLLTTDVKKMLWKKMQ